MTQAEVLEKGIADGYQIRAVNMFVMDLVKAEDVIRVFADGSTKPIPKDSALSDQADDDSEVDSTDEEAGEAQADDGLVNRNVRGWSRVTRTKVNWPARLRDHQELVRHWTNRIKDVDSRVQIHETVASLRALTTKKIGPFALGQCYAHALHLCNLLEIDMSTMFDTVEYRPEQWSAALAMNTYLAPMEAAISAGLDPFEPKTNPLRIAAIHLTRSLAVDFAGQPLAVREWGNKRHVRNAPALTH